jgi:hypothetical protein
MGLFQTIQTLLPLKRQQAVIGKYFSRRRHWILFVVTGVVIVHSLFYVFSGRIPGWQRRVGVSGFSYDKAHHFLYFHYYLGLFPVVSLEEKEYSREGALRVLEEKGESLRMEYRHWARLGEHARILCFWPNALVKNSPQQPSLKLFNALFFLLGLFCVIIGFSWVKMPLVGFFFAAIVSVTPFFLFEVYRSRNIFGLMASVSMILLGLHLATIFDRKPTRWACILPVVSGLLIGFAGEVRGEIMPLLLSCLMAYLFSRQLKLWPKVLFILLLFVSFIGARQGIRAYFDTQFDRAYEVVSQQGGHPYEGRRIGGHIVWHPIFCGLGDFDGKYGYRWDDRVAYRYALPVLKERYGLDLRYKGGYHLDEYYDKDRLYYKKFDEIPQYEQVIKEKVLHDIFNDPLWYVTILGKRLWRILTRTAPLPFLGLLAFPFLFIVFKFKAWRLFKLFLFTLPLCLSPFLIYSGDNSTFGSLYQVVALSCLLSWALEYLLPPSETT